MAPRDLDRYGKSEEEPGGWVLLMVRDGKGRVDSMSDVVVDGEEYDRAFYAHDLEELTRASRGLFAFDRELVRGERSIWVNDVFRRV